MKKKKSKELYVWIAVALFITGIFFILNKSDVPNQEVNESLSIVPQEFIVKYVQQPIIQNQVQSCFQIAQQNNAFYVDSVSTGNACQQYAITDCQQKGKVINQYGLQGSCCYYTCTNIIPQSTCTDSDGGQDNQQFIKGTITDGTQSYTDQCDWNLGGVTEYYCDGSTMKSMNFQCENYWTCIDGKCSQQKCEDIMNPTPEKCASGYTTDGGTCAYWNINGGICLSSFN
jgi:hypothetical protein